MPGPVLPDGHESETFHQDENYPSMQPFKGLTDMTRMLMDRFYAHKISCLRSKNAGLAPYWNGREAI